MTFEEWFWALLDGTLPPPPPAPVTFWTLYQEPTETTLFDVDERWIDQRLVNERRPEPMYRDELLRALRHIGSCDPDGGEVQPTTADYERHQEWAVQSYGRQVWERYCAGNWEPAPTWT